MSLSNLPLSDLSDAELREIIKLPAGKEGLRFYISKADKVRFIEAEDDETREGILAKARARQVEHHKYLRQRRRDGSPDRQVLIEDRMGGQTWRFVRKTRTKDGFKDGVTGRRARISYTVVSLTTDESLDLTKATLLDAHERLGLIVGWPPPRQHDAAPEANGAGTTTGAHLRTGLDLGRRS